jgi:predicted alpha/beta superfamily hydrolase
MDHDEEHMSDSTFRARRQICGIMKVVMFAVSACMGSSATAQLSRDTSPTPPREQRMTDTGALVEPSTRMRFKDAPWDYEVRVALPPSYDQSEETYPVLWVTDGSAFFDMAVTVASSSPRHFPYMIVVSIGTPPEARGKFSYRRDYDFTSDKAGLCNYDGPAKDFVVRDCKKRWGDHRFGGAKKFLEFISKDLRDEIAKRYRVTGDNTLFGFSLGGGFCIYALLTDPKGFDRYICASPNVIKGNRLFELEEHYAANHNDMQAKVFLSAGEGEILAYPAISAAGVVGWMSRMAEVLGMRGYPSLELHARIFPGEVHNMHGMGTGLYWGLRTLWTPRMQRLDGSARP